jgi:hypothetical protein
LTVPTLPELVEVFGSEAEPNGVLIVLFIPSKDKDGNDLSNQEMWADAASDLLSALFGGATIMPSAKGKWLNEETDQIITEPVVLIHCYARPSHASDEDRLKVTVHGSNSMKSRGFCKAEGRFEPQNAHLRSRTP